MKRLLSVLLAASICLPAFAAPPQTASIEKLLVLTDAQRENDSAIASSEELIEKTLKPRMQAESMPPERKKAISDFLDKYKSIVKEEFCWKKIRADYVEIYRELFTEEEIQSLIAFYESPAGQMLVKKNPEVMAKTSVLLQKKIISIMEKMEADMNAVLAPETPASH